MSDTSGRPPIPPDFVQAPAAVEVPPVIPPTPPVVPGTLGPNHDLPPVNPLKVRSTLAGFIAVLALLSPLLGGGIGVLFADIVANENEILNAADRLVQGFNAFLGVASLLWYAFERRAPHYRLSFRRADPPPRFVSRHSIGPVEGRLSDPLRYSTR